MHLKSGTTDEQRDQLVTSFSGLLPVTEAAALGCVTAGDGGSTHDLALFAYLTDAAALERFGTDARYMRYLQHSFLPLIEDFVSADVEVETGPATGYEFAVCFCLDIPPATYDWQVRALLSRLTSASKAAVSAAVGIALNERQSYRAAGVISASLDTMETVTRTLTDVAESDAVTGKISVAGRLTLWQRE
jgi:hypothetical protein